jgi:hypothetical protein
MRTKLLLGRLKGRDHSKYIGVYELRMGTGFCKHGNETLVSTKAGKFLD